MRISRSSYSSGYLSLYRKSPPGISGTRLSLLPLLVSLLLFFLIASLPAQIVSRNTLAQEIEAARAGSGAEIDARIGRLQGNNRNAENVLRFARLRNSVAARNAAAISADLQGILANADALGDDSTLCAVYPELAETLSHADGTASLIQMRDHALQQSQRVPHFPYFEIFNSLGQAFRRFYDDSDAEAAYDLAGQHLSGQSDETAAAYYGQHAVVLAAVGRMDRSLDSFQRARAIYARIGHMPTQLLVDNAELERHLGHYDAAEELANQARLIVSPTDSLRTRYGVQETLARIFIVRKQYPQALQCIRHAEALAPADDFMLQHLTFALYHDLYFESHNYAAMPANARAMLASAQSSGNERAINYAKGLLGLSLGLNGEVDKGIQLIEEAERNNHHSGDVVNLEQKYQVYEAAHRYAEALRAYREYKDAQQQWSERTNQQNLARLESSLALQKSEEKTRDLLAQQQLERNREEHNRLESLNLLHQQQLIAADAEQRRKDQQITALRAQGQLIAAEKMRQQLLEEQRAQQLQLDYLTHRSQLKNALAVLLFVCLLLAVAIAWLLWRISGTRKLQAMKDPLTGLHNRRFFIPFMEHESGRLRRSGLTALILMADIDLFKNVNDRWGHEAGDAALVKLAEILRGSTRNSDVISRWGGEEFVILCPQINEQHASVICDRIRHHLQQNSIQVPGAEPFHLTLSIGAAIFAPSLHGESWETALARADQALYQVKNNGRDGWALAAASQPGKPEPATI